MTPLDTLRAALDLVEQRLAAATTGAGKWWEDDGLSSWCVRSGAGPICADAMPDDATLIVTGVNLLPVVRDILADAIRYREQNLPGTGAALRLARAIVKDGDLT